MKFLRILPETWARTWCLFSNSTRNIALGSGSSTVAITSIASSLLIDSLNSDHSPAQVSAARHESLGQNDRSIPGHGHAVLEVGAITAIRGHRCPIVFQDAGSGFAGVDHRLYGQHHAISEPRATTAGTKIRDLRLFMEPRSNPVANK